MKIKCNIFILMILNLFIFDLTSQSIKNIELFNYACNERYKDTKYAEELLDKFILLNPTHKEALILKSNFRKLYDNDISGSITILESAINLCDDKVGLYYELSNTYFISSKGLPY